MQPKQDKNGFWYYNNLPENTRLAVIDDFYDDGRLILGKPFLIKSYIKKIFWANRVKKNFPYNDDFLNFLNNGRVFVYK